MEIIRTGVAGTMESSDIIVTIEPRETEGIELSLESDVMQQFGRQIEKVIRETLAEVGVTSACVTAVDKGALDCTVAARTMAAAYRAANSTDYVFKEVTKK
ncbi:MAG: citrate lyase acyl carrier protein [Clostridia bacterium]|nr:citrate lyase acyl carrier protein [Clostridia bacterium]